MRLRLMAGAALMVVVAAAPALVGTTVADGEIADWFGVDGVVVDDGIVGSGEALTVQAVEDDHDGSLYVLVNVHVLPATEISTLVELRSQVVKCTVDGSRDESYGSHGIAVLPRSRARFLVVRDDKSVVVAGDFGDRSLMVLDPAGRTTTFPELVSPFTRPPVQGERTVNNLLLLADGRVLVTASTIVGPRFLNPNGTLTGVPSLVRPAGSLGELESQLLSDGRILLTSYQTMDNGNLQIFCRLTVYDTNFVLDPTFGVQGTLDIPGCRQVVSEASGALLTRVFDPATSQVKYVRYSKVGAPVSTLAWPDGAFAPVRADGSGRLYRFDWAYGVTLLAAFTPDGLPDVDFGIAGNTPLPDGAGSGHPLRTGDFVVYGQLNNDTSLVLGLMSSSFGIAPEPPAISRGAFTPLPPTRVLDTRNGIGAPRRKPAAQSVTDVQLTGMGGVPNDGSVIAVAVNVTAVGAAGGGYVTAWPTGASRPSVSTLNYLDTSAVPNMVTTQLGVGGRLSLYTYASAELLVDVLGYYRSTDSAATAGRFQPVEPTRIVDTRAGVGLPHGQLPAGSTVDVQLAGSGGLPFSGVSAVALNLTATGSLSTGYVTMHPTGVARPEASNLNVNSGETRANFVIVPVGADGRASLFDSAGGDVLIDVVGWFTDTTADEGFDGLFVPISPQRITDSRVGGASPLPVGRTLTQFVGSTSVAPPYGRTGAAVLNITVVNPTSAGFVTLWPGETERPGVSNINVSAAPGATANAAIVTIGWNGAFQIDVETTAHLLIDIAGFYLAY